MDAGARDAAQADMDSVSRRRLLRAGLAAAPVVATLHSTPVLATTGSGVCIRPSSFSSLQTTQGFQISRARAADVNKLTFNCDSVATWKGKYITKPNKKPDESDPTTKLLCTPVKDYFPSFPSGVKLSTSESRTFYKILCDGSDKEKKTVALYLTAATLPTASLLTTQQCADYWLKGYFSPFNSKTSHLAVEYVNTMTTSGVTITSL